MTIAQTATRSPSARKRFAIKTPPTAAPATTSTLTSEPSKEKKTAHAIEPVIKESRALYHSVGGSFAAGSRYIRSPAIVFFPS